MRLRAGVRSARDGDHLHDCVGYADDALGIRSSARRRRTPASLASAVGVCVNDETSSGSYSVGDALKITVEYPYNFLSFIRAVFGNPRHADEQRDDDAGDRGVGNDSRPPGSATRIQHSADRAQPGSNGTTGYTSVHNDHMNHESRQPDLRHRPRARRAWPGARRRRDRAGGADRDRRVRDQHGGVVGRTSHHLQEQADAAALAAVREYVAGCTAGSTANSRSPTPSPSTTAPGPPRPTASPGRAPARLQPAALPNAGSGGTIVAEINSNSFGTQNYTSGTLTGHPCTDRSST